MESEMECMLRLYASKSIGLVEKVRLIALFGSASQLIQCSAINLEYAGLSLLQIEDLYNPNHIVEAQKLQKQCDDQGIRIIAISHDEYPEMLRYIHDPPIVLFVRGKIPKEDAIAIVGSRKASGYGIESTVKLASELARSGVTVVSGLARGIDTAAHSGALQAGGKTVSVLGCGVDISYPPENKGLMNRIIESGAVISEYPPGTRPATFHFPCRNRIISGMAYGTLVVEAGLKSGSLITATQAVEQGREVFAVPGNITHYNSMGTNRLIKDGAKMVLSVEDILEELPMISSDSYMNNKTKSYRQENISKDEKEILGLLKIEDLYDEEIAQRINKPIATLYELLLGLELKGYILKSLSGKYRHLA